MCHYTWNSSECHSNLYMWQSYHCCIRQDGTQFDIKCAFNYSDNLVIISQITPVTIQNKNHIEIIQIRTQIKMVICREISM